MTTEEGFLTARMVTDRCTRMYRHNQWKLLYEFCLREPRAQEWTLKKIGNTPDLNLLDIKVRELLQKLKAIQPPVPAVAPPDDEKWDDVDMRSVELRPLPPRALDEDAYSIDMTQDLYANSHPPRPVAFVTARAKGDFVAAAQALLSHVNGLAPGMQPAIDAVDFTEVAAELCVAGHAVLLVQLCSKLPERITASALLDVGARLKLGALLQEPVQWFEQASKEVPDDDEKTQKSLDQMLLAAVKSTLGG